MILRNEDKPGFESDTCRRDAKAHHQNGDRLTRHL
jgi:hypothetical protein